MLLSLRSNPQTESPYIQNCDGLYTRTDYYMLLPIVLHIVVPFVLNIVITSPYGGCSLF